MCKSHLKVRYCSDIPCPTNSPAMLENCEYVWCLIIDFSRAFDVVNYVILLDKLSKLILWTGLSPFLLTVHKQLKLVIKFLVNSLSTEALCCARRLWCRTNILCCYGEWFKNLCLVCICCANLLMILICQLRPILILTSCKNVSISNNRQWRGHGGLNPPPHCPPGLLTRFAQNRRENIGVPPVMSYLRIRLS